ncbi:hypothetical protein AB0I60_02700 [Actinosynnema sp. NPDC050436]|uniref:hypothetical protein n=1 Tax=Actinosynnema sp. NPDC050436 TaxID=3155659 RepID=UPI0033DDFDB1
MDAASPAPARPLYSGAPCRTNPDELGAFAACSYQNPIDPSWLAFCHSFPAACQEAKARKSPGLGTRSNDHKGSPRSGGGKKSGKSNSGSGYPTAPNGDYETPDGLWHRPNGKGWAYF